MGSASCSDNEDGDADVSKLIGVWHPVHAEGYDVAGGQKETWNKDIDVTVDNRSEKIGFKIREARLDKLPYMLVVGQQEEADGTVSVRSRFAGNEGTKSLDEFIDAICKEIRTKEIRKELPEEEKKR